jgi:DNA-binding transcriptional ArsR family regulator
MNNSIYDIQADFCKVMGNPSRLQIIHALREHPMNVGEIAHTTGFSQSLVSRQLGTLRNIGAVEFQRHGNEIIYRLTNENIAEFCDLVRKFLVTQAQKQSDFFRT